jgi:two-component system, OmpR family, response regulator
MRKVLVVDDTKNIRLLLTKCLQLEGYEVTTAGDGLQAIDLIKNNDFDLIFLDIKLPEIRGTEVLKRIREMGIQTPVIIITAYATVKNAVDCTQLGAVAYVQKPFTADKIRSVLSEFHERQQNIPRIGFDIEKLIAGAESLLQNKEYSDALELLAKAISKELTNPNLFLLVAKAYEGLGNMEYADKYYKTYQLFLGKQN